MNELAAMFMKQRAFMQMVGADIKIDLNTSEGQSQARALIFWTVQELFEASHLLQLKPWRRKLRQRVKKEAFKEELIDAIHFFLELCIALDINAKELFQLYEHKLKKNYLRQQQNY